MLFYILFGLVFGIRKTKIKVGTKCYRALSRNRPVANVPGCHIYHTIAPGENAQTLLTRYSISLSQLQDANKGVNLNQLNVGFRVFIPVSCGYIPQYPIFMDNTGFVAPAMNVNSSAFLALAKIADYDSASSIEMLVNQILYDNFATSNLTILDWREFGEYFSCDMYTNNNQTLYYDNDFRIEGYNINGRMHYIVRSKNGSYFDPGRNRYSPSMNIQFQRVYSCSVF